MGALTLGSVTLHPRMAWVNEFDQSTDNVSRVRTLSGKLIAQHGTDNGGRSIILSGGAAQRSLLDDLRVLQNTGNTHTLTLQDGRTFSVEFEGQDSLKATPIGKYHNPTDDDYFELEIDLIEVSS